MRITVEVSEDILQAAEARQRPLIEFVQELMARGLEGLAPRQSMVDAIERIRALRGTAITQHAAEPERGTAS